MGFIGEGYIYLGCDTFFSKEKQREFKFAKFANPETFENFSMMVFDDSGVILPNKTKIPVDIVINPSVYNNRTNFTLVDVVVRENVK